MAKVRQGRAMENDGLADGLAALGTVSAPQSYAAVLRRRLDAVLASLPIGCDSSGSDEALHIKAPAIEPLPDWLTIPVQLHEAWASERTGKPVADLGDVLWAQYALFLYIRLQTEIFLLPVEHVVLKADVEEQGVLR